jgi:hypothetical protein
MAASGTASAGTPLATSASVSAVSTMSYRPRGARQLTPASVHTAARRSTAAAGALRAVRWGAASGRRSAGSENVHAKRAWRRQRRPCRAAPRSRCAAAPPACPLAQAQAQRCVRQRAAARWRQRARPFARRRSSSGRIKAAQQPLGGETHAPSCGCAAACASSVATTGLKDGAAAAAAASAATAADASAAAMGARSSARNGRC